MISNTDLTILHREYDIDTGYDKWIKTYISNAWWFENSGSTISSQGQNANDTFTVRIERTDLLIEKGDLLVRGKVDIEVNLVSDLKNYDYFKVTGVNVNSFGGTPHTKVVGE